MKKVLNIFSRMAGERTNPTADPSFREPRLYATHSSSRPAAASRETPPQKQQRESAHEMIEVPFEYPGIIAFFQKTVSDRKSPFNALVQAADRLKEYIPDEVSRLKAAYALCGDKWSPDVLTLAIQNHIADVDSICTKAKYSKGLYAGKRASQMRADSAELKNENIRLQAEIDRLKASLADLQARFHTNESRICALDQQAQLIEADAHSVALLEQAAENLKNDLLAKKILLGLS